MFVPNRFLLIISILCPIWIFAQTNDIGEEYRVKSDIYKGMHPPAMVYFHFDKAAYHVGDSVHYKAYQIEDEKWMARHTPQFFNIEIVDLATQKVVQNEQALLDEGVAIGAFRLDKKLPAGTYRFKIDAHLMNFNAPNIDFTYDFKLLGADRKDLPKPTLEVAFFPEGGNLVQGIMTKVAIRATEDVQGAIVNEKGDSLMPFFTYRGLGQIRLRPKSTDKLYGRVRGERFALPLVAATGVTLTLDNANPNADISIILNGKLAEGVPQEQVTVVNDWNGRATQFFDAQVNNGKNIILFPRRGLRHGVSRIQVLNPKGEILCERLLYNHAPPTLFLATKSTIKDTDDEQEITLSFDLTDSEGKIANANLSIAVTDSLNQIESIDNEDIITHFSLQQMLSKPIASNGIFSKNALIDAKNLDLLLLTEKLGRYKWSDIKAYQYKPLDPYRIPYRDERLKQKMRSFVPQNGLIYWNPEVIIIDGKGTLTFRAPKNTILKYNIQGMAREGLVVSQKY